jgi:hypothetical protein
MIYMLIEHFRPGCAPQVYRRLRERGRMALGGPQVRALLPGDANRADLIDFEIVPVRSSTEAAAMMHG